MNGNWASSLTIFAKSTQPASLPSDVYLRHNEHTLTIFDGYPKAKYHFLVLPRIPFKLSTSSNAKVASPKLALAGGKLSLGASASPTQVPPNHLHSLSDLLASPYASEVLGKMQEASEQVVSLIKEEMKASSRPSKTAAGVHACGVDWGVRVGFHAVPSMDTIHLHVLSDDLVSERLKNKKHYNSFHPGLGFWLDLNYVQELVAQGRKALPHSQRHYEELLKRPLISFRNIREYSNIPRLKEHLEQAWKEDVLSRVQQRQQTEKKRKSDTEPKRSTSASKPRKITNDSIARVTLEGEDGETESESEDRKI